MPGITLEDILRIQRIVGDHTGEYSVTHFIKYSNILKNILEYPDNIDAPLPTSLKQTCTGFNCVCYRDGIVKKCIPYNRCLQCYRDLISKRCISCDS